MRIVNLTQHQATAAQQAEGVFDIPAHNQGLLKNLLTFEEIPTREEMETRAAALVILAEGALDGVSEPAAMIDPAPYFIGPLEEALREAGITPLYSFTKREVVEKSNPD